MEWHPAAEEYCECIFELGESEIDAIQARIAERLKVTRPAVSEMVRRLEADGLLKTTAGRIELTASGRTLAEQVVRRHRLAERFLTDMLGLSWAAAHREAGKWEHVISADVEDALTRVLGDPTTCPHGNPIPGTAYRAPDAHPLSSVAVGTSFTVSRIPEELELEPEYLTYLEQSAITPGRTGRVAVAAPDGTVTVEMTTGFVALGPFASARILVTV